MLFLSVLITTEALAIHSGAEVYQYRKGDNREGGVGQTISLILHRVKPYSAESSDSGSLHIVLLLYT